MVVRVFLLVFVCFFSTWATVDAVTITKVVPYVSVSGGCLPPLVQKRLAASIQTIGNHVLIGQSAEDVAANPSDYYRVINDVINRVLIGYTVENVTVTPGSATDLAVTIRPWSDTIQRVKVQVDYGTLSSLGKTLVDQDLKQVQPIIESVLVGLPIDASLDWANGISQSMIQERLAEVLPEFAFHVTILSGLDTTVQIYLVPTEPVIREVAVSVKSNNLPRIIFLNTKKNLEMEYTLLEGLPVAFIRRHQNEVAAAIQDSLQKQWVIKQYHLKVVPALTIGEHTDVLLTSTTDFYSIQAGAYIDVGRDKNNRDSTVLQVHLGRKIGSSHELYMETELDPSSMRWNFIPGYSYHWGRYTKLGYEHESEDNSNRLWVKQRFGDRWQFRLERNLRDKNNEIGLSYDVHEYITLEYIMGDHENWLRVIGHL